MRLFFRGEGGEMSDVKIKAEADYMSGMKYKDIAEKYNVSMNTVKTANIINTEKPLFLSQIRIIRQIHHFL